MKKLILITALATLSYAEVITVIDNGVERKIEVNASVKQKARMVNGQGSDIIVAFKKGVKVDIASFEKKYNIKLKKRLIAGYYTFSNDSNLTDLKLISKIVQGSKSIIKTVRPNWGFNNRPR